MASYYRIAQYNAHADRLLQEQFGGDFKCPICGEPLNRCDAFEDSEGYRIEYWCRKCDKPVTELFEMVPKGFYFYRPKMVKLDPEKATIADLLTFLKSAGTLATADHKKELETINVELCGYATSFVAELVEKSVALSEKLAEE
jgi:predicted RNA-binding Zn-ribbon protein involved in translation (DUF1610 family)